MHFNFLGGFCIVSNAFGAVMEKIGELIRCLRKAEKLSQQALAQQYGMSRATISGIENNTISEIGLRKVEAILNGFGYELAAIPAPLDGRHSTRCAR